MLTDSCLDTLEEAWCDSGGNNKRRVKKLFGEDIRFTPAEMNDFNLPDVSFLTDLSTGIEAVHSFSMKYDGGNSFSSSTKEDKKPVSKRSVSS